MMKGIILIALACSIGLETWAKDGETRSTTVKMNISASDEIDIQAKYTDLTIESWDKNEVEIEASVRFDGKMTTKIQEFLEEFEARVKDNIDKAGGVLTIDTDLDLPNKVQIGGKYIGINISYGDDDLKITYKIKAPGTNKYSISNSYEDARMIGKFSDILLTQYSGELEADYIEKAVLNLKYGSASIAELGDAEMELYEQELEIESVERLEIDTKYSDIEIYNSGSIESIAYESEFALNSARSLSGNFKYGKIEIEERLEKGTFECYEVDMEIKQARELTYSNSKYSSLVAGNIGSLVFDQSYEDETEINNLGIFKSSNSKYGKHNIGTLNRTFDLRAYEDEVSIDAFGPEASRITIDGKYIETTLQVGGAAFHLKSDVKYGKVDYDESTVEVKRYIKDGDNLELEMLGKQSTKKTSIEMSITGYEIKISLK